MKKHSRKLLYLVILLAVAVFKYYKHEKKATVKTNSNFEELNSKETAIIKELTFNYLPTSTSNQVIYHDYYTLSYREEHEQAEWVAYELKPEFISKLNRKRPYFIYDSLVKTKSANYRNYKKSGYDRGHLVPAGDMRFSLNAFNDTFYTSNISPQNHDFNAGIWNRLEQKTRYWTKKYGTLYVITGGILEGKLKTIGKEKVSVPELFYKIILDYKPSIVTNKIKAIAFLMRSKDSDEALYKFVVPIDEIEKLTGIDFFSDLPNDMENALESSSDYKDWSFR